MTRKEDIGQRIKKLRIDHKFSQAYVAKKLFVSQSAYSLMESCQNSIVSEHIVRLSKLYNVTADYILTGNKKLIDMTLENGFIPLIDAKAHAGILNDLHKEDVMEDFEYYKVPGFNPTKDSVLIEIKGDSMQPTVMAGDVLLCQTQHNMDYVLDGSIVVLVTKEDLLTTRLFKHEDNDYFWMESDNPDEKGRTAMKKSRIRQVLMVRGKVSNVLIPHNEMAFKGKIKSLEESLDALGKEVYNMSKKLKSLNGKKQI